MNELMIIESFINDEIDINNALILLEEVGSKVDHPTLEKLRKIKEMKGIKAADKKLTDMKDANKEKLNKDIEQAVSKISKDTSCENYEKKIQETKEKIDKEGKVKAKVVEAICATLLVLPLTPIVNLTALAILATNKYTTNYGKSVNFSFSGIIDGGVNKVEELEEKRRKLVSEIKASKVKEELYEKARSFMTLASSIVKKVQMIKYKIVRAVRGPKFVSATFRPAFAESVDDFNIISRLSALMEKYDKYDVLDMYIEKTEDDNLIDVVNYFL